MAPVEIAPHLPGEQEILAWSDSEIAAAEIACATQLAEIALDYEKLPPIKEGLCGTPAPILLRSIGRDPAVVIDPPATVTCTLAVTLEAWLKDKVQPAAMVAFGAEVVKLRNALSYVCRNRYGGGNTRISEHGLANALDISAFVFASGKRITVLDDWPHVAPLAPMRDADGNSTASVIEINGAPAPASPPLGELSIDQLLAALPPAEDPEAERRTNFVTAMHAEACKMFGTVLGPRANEAHRDHFHFDMKPRRHANYCE